MSVSMSAPLSPDISLRPEKPESPAWGWKLLAIVMALLVLIGDVPKLGNPSAQHPVQIILFPINCIALAGLFQYSFDRWERPTESFWRPFAIFFGLVTAAQIGFALPPIAVLLKMVGGSLMGVMGVIIGVGLPLLLAILVNVALLRLGRWIGPNKRRPAMQPEVIAGTV